MAVDITLLFKASVKTVKTRNKAIGIGFDSTKDEIFKRSRTKSGFSQRAKEVITNITKLKDFLLQHRKDYISAGSLISSDLTRMTDGERDQIDQDAQIFMRTCSEAIKQLRSEVEKQAAPAQIKEHRGAVLDLVETYLRGVCKVYSEQRAIRVKRMVDKKRLLPSAEKSSSEVQGSSVSLWEEGRVEDELSPEEIQMVRSTASNLILSESIQTTKTGLLLVVESWFSGVLMSKYCFKGKSINGFDQLILMLFF
uniref:Syntaxin 18 n=1 Tax=Oryzias melastigma TaxID=30732 RepID=A0A3B3DPH7_ORYME